MSKLGKPIRVLLADDHAAIRAGIQQFLQLAKDIEIIAEAENGEEAQILIGEHQPDVAVLDIKMPKRTGIEVTRWIRSHCQDIGILILTAYDDEPSLISALQAGANGYVLKTSTPFEMIQAVRDVYEGKSAVPISLAQKLARYISNQANHIVIEPLSDREMDVLHLLAKGCTNRAMGTLLGISERTVQNHLAHIFQKMHVKTRTEAVMQAVSLGWVLQQK